LEAKSLIFFNIFSVSVLDATGDAPGGMAAGMPSSSSS